VVTHGTSSNEFLRSTSACRFMSIGPLHGVYLSKHKNSSAYAGIPPYGVQLFFWTETPRFHFISPGATNRGRQTRFPGSTPLRTACAGFPQAALRFVVILLARTEYIQEGPLAERTVPSLQRSHLATGDGLSRLGDHLSRLVS
jgi:hypothetical protein